MTDLSSTIGEVAGIWRPAPEPAPEPRDVKAICALCPADRRYEVEAPVEEAAALLRAHRVAAHGTVEPVRGRRSRPDTTT